MSLARKEPEPPEYIVSPRKRTPQEWRKIISKSPQGNDYFRSENTDWNITYRFGPTKASLARIPEDEIRFPITLWVKKILTEGIQFLQLNSIAMRRPCRSDTSVPLQMDGSNLPKTIKYLQELVDSIHMAHTVGWSDYKQLKNHRYCLKTHIPLWLTNQRMTWIIMPSAGLCRVTTLSRFALSRNSFTVLTIPIELSIRGT